MYRGYSIKRADPEPNPSPAQLRFGNYKKDHISIQGIRISIETLGGTVRKGIDTDGETWSVTMPEDYGYIKGTVGADGDQVDCYVGENKDSDTVWIINQKDISTGKFDEHKCFIGFDEEQDAIATYVNGFEDGKGLDRMMDIRSMTIQEFKNWLDNDDTTKKASPLSDVQQADIDAIYRTILARRAERDRERKLRRSSSPGMALLRQLTNTPDIEGY